jgi:hypothetical protein
MQRPAPKIRTDVATHGRSWSTDAPNSSARPWSFSVTFGNSLTA